MYSCVECDICDRFFHTGCIPFSLTECHETYWGASNIHYRKKLWNIWKAQWKHSYLTFWFDGHGLAPNTNKNYCYFNAILTCGVIGENAICNVRIWLYTMDGTGMYHYSPKISRNFQCIHHYIVNLWTFFCIKWTINDITQTLWPVAGQQFECYTKWRKGVTQDAVSCHLVFSGKSASFV